MPAQGYEHARTILVAEEEPEVRHSIEEALACCGYTVEFAKNEEGALATVGSGERDISLLLLGSARSTCDTQETIRKIRHYNRQLPIILLVNEPHATPAVEPAYRAEVEFLSRSVCRADLTRAVRRVLRVPDGAGPDRGGAAQGQVICFRNPQMQRIESALLKIGESDAPVLLQGESGVGKEVVARRLHSLSPRAGKPFLKLNCAALPAELLESELFGYERGAFTGAFKSKSGKFEAAAGGAILLDEIGDMDYRLQAKLLQVLQDHEFHRLGGKQVHVDVRIMAATHRNLEAAIVERSFREDLYYRLNVVSLELPPLRERKDEILPLAELFLAKHAGRTTVPDLTEELQQALLAYHWPGNIRELENAMRRYLVFRDPNMLADELRAKMPGRPTAATTAPQTSGFECAPEGSVLEKLNEAKAQAETQAILAALQSTRWNRKQAAALLNTDYKALLYKMKKLGMSEP